MGGIEPAPMGITPYFHNPYFEVREAIRREDLCGDQHGKDPVWPPVQIHLKKNCAFYEWIYGRG